MVSRKALPQSLGASAPASQTTGDLSQVLGPGASAAGTLPNLVEDATSVWQDSAMNTEQTQQQQPPPPPFARPPPVPALPHSGADTPIAELPSANPFKRKMLSPTAKIAVPSTSASLSPPAGIAELSASEPAGNPWLSSQPESWAAAGGSTTAKTNASATVSSEPDLISFSPSSEPDRAGWDEVALPSSPSGQAAVPLPLDTSSSKDQTGEERSAFDRHAWDDVGHGTNRLADALQDDAVVDGWSVVVSQPVPGQLSRRSTWENFSDDDDNDDKKAGDQETATKAKNAATVSGASDSRGDDKGASKVANADTVQKAEAPAVLASFQNLQIGSNGAGESQLQGHTEAPVPTAHATDSLVDIDDVGPPPMPPPRPVDNGKTETYQIKNISWYDIKAAENPRLSPILLQNANGPCPLVALVNALTLTTPAGKSTGLVEALQTREQVSLDLLLDAVLDELISYRRPAEAGYSLPDLDELYKFLKGLHTGMNVNPRFIPTPDVVTAFRRTSLGHLHPLERNDIIPGTFEDTREMQLYAAFDIPLMHGWVPSKDESAYDAMSRRAATYEDVQNLLFREEELDAKLSSPTGDGLSEEEQELYQDILEIRMFLDSSATQLTPYGLEVLAKALQPGAFAILFRNDHFSTLYRQPQTLQLLSLVTDAGYATHDEVIWETLVDVNGEHAEFFSGDFRLVGGTSQAQDQQGHGHGASSSSAAHAHQRSGRRGRSSLEASSETGQNGRRPLNGKGAENNLRTNASQGHDMRHYDQILANSLSKHEQEDRDLALALQLQEEEEERQRSREESRLRESRLSEQLIEQQSRQSSTQGNGTGPGRSPSAGNVAGGGRYGPAQQLPVSPRRSSANQLYGGPLLPPGQDRRRTSSTSVAQSSQPRPLQQRTVRSLVPSAGQRVNTRPAVHREADVDSGEEAPPSYEHAAKQAPYIPPTETNSNASSSIGMAGGRSGSSSNPALPMRPQFSNTGASAAGRPYRQPMPVQQQGTPNRERDCIVM